MINKRNEILNIELFIVPIHQRDQDMYWCFIRDITEKIQAEANLIHSQRMLNQSQEIANIGSWELDINMGKMSWTDELYKIRGLVPQQQEVDNDLLFYYTHPDDRAMLKTVIQQTLKEKIPYNINYRIVRADGTIRVLQDIGQPILDDSGRVIKLQGFEKDITEIVRVSEEIEMQKRFTEVVLNNLPADIAVFDPGHHYRFINPNGIKNDELRKWMIGKTDFDYCELKNIDTGIAEKEGICLMKQFKPKQQFHGLMNTKIKKVAEIIFSENFIPTLKKKN